MEANRKELATILVALNEGGKGMTITEISKAVGLNRHSVAKYLDVLVASGQVDRRAFGPSRIFSLSRRVPISAMLSLSSDLIVTLDGDMRFRYVNDRFLKFTGLGLEEVMGKNITNFSQSLRTEPPFLPYVTIALTGKEEIADIFYPRGTKGYYFIFKAIPTAFEGGEKGVTLIMSDITARVEAEEALRKERAELEVRVKKRTAELEAEIAKRISYENALMESEEKYRNLVENVNDWIWEQDAAGRFIYSSPKVFDLLGYRPDEIMGLMSFDLMTPQNRKKMRDRMMQIFPKDGTLEVLEAEHLHKDGHAVFIEVSGKPVYGPQGNLTGYRGIARDITARKQAEEAQQKAEEKLRNTIENVNDIVWEMDRDARFTYVSPKVRDILGFGSEHYVGHVISEFMPSEDLPVFMGGFGRIYANPRPYSFEYFRMFHKDGRILSFEVNGSPFYDDDGHFLGFQGVTRDITKRKLTGQ